MTKQIKKIDVTSGAIEKGFEIAKEFLQKLIGPPVEQIGLLLADNVRYWRLKNQIGLLEKASKYVQKNGIVLKRVPLKIIAPLIEGASLEESEDLQNKWLALLINYIDSSKSHRSTIFPYILTQLSTNEAKCVDFMRDTKSLYISFNVIPKELNIYDAELSNLIRLGLIRKVPQKIILKQPRSDWDGNYTQEAEYDRMDLRYELTELGYEFVDACRLE